MEDQGYRYELRLHGRDNKPGLPSNSNAASGWTFRIYRSKIGTPTENNSRTSEYMDNNGVWIKDLEKQTDEVQNNTHHKF